MTNSLNFFGNLPIYTNVNDLETKKSHLYQARAYEEQGNEVQNPQEAHQNYKQAISHYHEAFKYIKVIDDEALAVYNAIGKLYFVLCDYEMALTYYQKIEQLDPSNNNIRVEIKQIQDVLNNDQSRKKPKIMENVQSIANSSLGSSINQLPASLVPPTYKSYFFRAYSFEDPRNPIAQPSSDAPIFISYSLKNRILPSPSDKPPTPMGPTPSVDSPKVSSEAMKVSNSEITKHIFEGNNYSEQASLHLPNRSGFNQMLSLAIGEYKKALAMDPYNVDALNGLIRNHSLLGQETSVFIYLERLIEVQPDNIKAKNLYQQMEINNKSNKDFWLVVFSTRLQMLANQSAKN